MFQPLSSVKVNILDSAVHVTSSDNDGKVSATALQTIKTLPLKGAALLYNAINEATSLQTHAILNLIMGFLQASPVCSELSTQPYIGIEALTMGSTHLVALTTTIRIRMRQLIVSDMSQPEESPNVYSLTEKYFNLGKNNGKNVNPLRMIAYGPGLFFALVNDLFSADIHIF
jgi:hypothetical protein